MHQHQYPFQTSFWSPTASIDTIPNFSHGFNVLHNKLQQSVEENKAITEYLKQRIAVEEKYAQQLASLQDSSCLWQAPGKAFDRDVGAGLKKCFEVMRAESTESVEAHRRRADNLVNTALDPIERFAKRYERILTTAKNSMHERISAFESKAQALEKAQSTYFAKCAALQSIYPDFRPPDDRVWLGQWLMTRRQVFQLLQYIRHGAKSSDPLSGQLIKERAIAYCSAGHDGDDEVSSRGQSLDAVSIVTLLIEQQKLFNNPEQDAMKLCEALFNQGYLQPLSSGDTFQATSSAYYTVHSESFAGYGLDDVTSEEKKASNANDHLSNGRRKGGFLGRWGRNQNSYPNGDPEQMYQEMVEADRIYRECVKQVEAMRMQTEEILFAHYEEMESLELERIQVIKQAFISMAATMSNSIPLCKEMYDRMMLYQETLKPDKDVQFIVEQYRTGRYCPKPFVYKNYFYGSAMDQVFGVPLEEYAKAHKTLVPPLVTQGLAAIESAFSSLYKEERSKMWTADLLLDRAHEARERLNTPTSSLAPATETFERYDVLVLASLLRLYFMELPECLLTFELYDPIKQLYTNHLLDEQSRCNAIRKLLTTLPSSNFYTLKALINHLFKLVKESEDEKEAEELLHNLASAFSYILIRPQVESNLNAHDRHPQRLARDLISHFETIFSEESLRDQEEYAKRRAIVVGNETSIKEPSLDASSTSSSVSSQNPATPTSRIHFEASTSSTRQDGDEQALHGPTRRRTLLSFMRRNTTTNVESSSNSNSTLTRSKSMMHRPVMPIPSSSTLFEDPDETPSYVSRKAAEESKSQVAPKEGTRSRASSIGITLLDDHGSLDSFFKDDE